MSQTEMTARPRVRKIFMGISFFSIGLLTLYYLQPDSINTMGMIKTPAGMHAGIPQIDKVAPTKTETATFSLG